MVYLDTSVLVKLYIREQHSRKVSQWVRRQSHAIALTSLHTLEFINAISLKEYRNELSTADRTLIKGRFDQHERAGVYYHPPIDWVDVMHRAHSLSHSHTGKIGSRSLDIVHVALALSMGMEQFLSLDERQNTLARLAGLQCVELVAK